MVRFNNLVFEKGVAHFENKLFSGIVRDTLKESGDAIEIVYKDGLPQVSKRVGVINFAKRWTNGKIYTYNGENLYTDSDFIIRGKIGNCERIAENSGNLHTVKTPDGRFLSVFNQNGNRSIIMRSFDDGHRDMANVRVLEGKDAIYDMTDSCCSERAINFNLDTYGVFDKNGIWATASKQKLNNLSFTSFNH